MSNSAISTRVPVPVVLLVVLALAVAGLLLAQFAIGFVLSIIRLSLIGAAFSLIGFAALYLWRRGDISGPDN